MNNKAAIAILGLALACACSEDEPINRVGVNVVEKAIFTDSWYFGNTVIDVDYEGASLGTFAGDVASDLVGSGFTTIPRLRWVITEDTLFGYRDYQIIEGIDGEKKEAGDYIGQPVVAFAIESHFDIRHAYNTVTGEERNVIVENDTDRRWFEREYMRVDWSTNRIAQYYGQTHQLLDALGLGVEREPASDFVQSNSQFPESWKPKFRYMSCDGPDDERPECLDEDRAHATDYDLGELYYIDFVTQELISPRSLVLQAGSLRLDTGINRCLFEGGPECSVVRAFTRSAFLKVSDSPSRREAGRENFREYRPENWTDTRWEQAGYFRNTQLTYDRQTAADDVQWGATDFLNFNINRHNIWQKWTDGEGNALPYSEREVRKVVWHTTPELPAHLVQPSFETVGSWNEVFMSTVRSLRGQEPAGYPRIDCQTEDPDAACFCTEDPNSGEILNPTCAGGYDPFESPEAAAARGVDNPYDCYVEVPEGAEPNMADPDVAARLRDADFNGWYGASFTGSECVTTLVVNSCNRASFAQHEAAVAAGEAEGELACQERGDIRYKFFSYVDQPGTPFLGVATLRADPVSGELIFGDANIGGPALDGFRTFALQQYDLLNGNLTEEDLIYGEDVRAHFADLNRVQLPAPPRINFNVALAGEAEADPAILAEIDERMAKTMERAERLQGDEGLANTFVDRAAALAGSDIEARLFKNQELLAAAGLESLPDGENADAMIEQHSEALLDQLSPFRGDIHKTLDAQMHRDDLLGRANFLMPDAFDDASVQYFVNKHADWPRARLEFALNRLMFAQTQKHELGHCFGLRHDFGASADIHNYYDDYYVIKERFALPDPAEYDVDGTPGLSPDEQLTFERAYGERKKLRELAGIDQWMQSSIMEYTANWYQRVQPGLGKYDFAAVALGYGDIAEVYDNSDSKPLTDITPINTSRLSAKYYHGGESCESDSDCPYSATGAQAGELLSTNMDAGLTQRCLAHPRSAQLGGVCSNFREDHAALSQSNVRYAPVSYRFCSDERAGGGGFSPGSIGWCNRFDEGDTYREIVRNVAEGYERDYLWTAFRRYRRNFSIGSYYSRLVSRRLILLQNVYQNLLYQYVSDPAFRESTGAFGFYDEFLATADIMNFYARLLSQPRVGEYVWSERFGRYERRSQDFDSPSAQLSMPIGPGRYMWSVYQRGLSGLNRIERVGNYYDRVAALQLLTSRGGQFTQWNYNRDVAFYTNFYDLFPLEMQQLFNGMIREAPEEYMPRVRCVEGSQFPDCFDPQLLYMNFYRGDCTEGSDSCREAPQEAYKDELVINGGSNYFVQYNAAALGLIYFPVYFDTTFQNQLFICVEGQGQCHRPQETAVEDVDYVRYKSERYGRNFLAWQVSPTSTVANQRSIGFAMVKEASDLAFILRMIEKMRDPATRGDPDPSRLDPDELARLTDPDGINYEIPMGSGQLDDDEDAFDSRLRQLESFFNQLMQLQSAIGIRSGFVQ